MRALITIAYLVFLHRLCNAQVDTVLTTDKKINAKIKLLRLKNVDTLAIYYKFCSGCYPPPVLKDSCYIYQEKYLLWHQEGQYYMEKFDECNEYSSLIINSIPYRLLTVNYSKIQKERIRPPEFATIVNGKQMLIGLSKSDGVYCTTLEICTTDKIIRKEVEDYYFDAKYVDGKHLNKNYIPNRKSVLFKLKTAIEKEVKLHYK